MKKTVILITVILITIGLTYFSSTYLTSNFYLNRDNKINTNETALNETPPEPIQFTNLVYPVAEKDKKFLCGDNIQNSNAFISEFIIPIPCSQPVGLTVDKNDNIWIAAVWAGYLLVFESGLQYFYSKHLFA